MLTAAADTDDLVDGLGLGADDYLGKPFEFPELIARIGALFRRAQPAVPPTIHSGDLTLDLARRTATRGRRRLDLTPREFDLLYFFARQPGKVFSRMDLLNAVWGYRHEGYEHTVNNHINRLRAKVEVDPSQPARILTVWGRGYKFADAGEAA